MDLQVLLLMFTRQHCQIQFTQEAALEVKSADYLRQLLGRCCRKSASRAGTSVAALLQVAMV